MKVSGFTFLRNGVKLGYPFVESIRSVLPIVDEFIIALGPSPDGTEEQIQAIGDPNVLNSKNIKIQSWEPNENNVALAWQEVQAA